MGNFFFNLSSDFKVINLGKCQSIFTLQNSQKSEFNVRVLRKIVRIWSLKSDFGKVKS